MVQRSLNDVKHSEVSALGQIIQSPYEGNQSAEVGEYLFEYTQSLMDSEERLNSTRYRESRHDPSDEAIEVFGKECAHTIVRTVRSITSSGILYSCNWIDGTIQQRYCGKLEKELLLLCLHDHRIARTSATIIKQVIKDLGVWEILVDLLSTWKLVDNYPQIARCSNINSFKRKQTQCFKCIIFIARAAICMKYLEWDFLAISNDTSLKTKVFACFAILESLLTNDRNKQATKKVSTQESASLPGYGTLSSTHTTHQSGHESARHQSDLSCRLRSKHYTIKGVQIHSTPGGKRPRVFKTTDESRNTKISFVHEAVSDDESKKKRKLVKFPSCSLLDKGKRQKTPLSHQLFEMKKSAFQMEIGNDNNCVSQNEKEKNPCINSTYKSATSFSHALFDTKINSTQIKNEENVVDMPKTFAHSMNRDKPSYVSDGSSMHSNSNNPNYWYPFDSNEIILNPTQIEMAWLVEESLFCTRKSDIDWSFVMKYASPSLQIQLRKIPCFYGDRVEEIPAEFFQNGIETKRFGILRREVRRKLLKSAVRVRMEGILPRLRRATNPLLLQKIRSNKMTAASAESSPTANDIVL